MHKFPQLCEFVAQMGCDECDREREELRFQQQELLESIYSIDTWVDDVPVHVEKCSECGVMIHKEIDYTKKSYYPCECRSRVHNKELSEAVHSVVQELYGVEEEEE